MLLIGGNSILQQTATRNKLGFMIVNDLFLICATRVEGLIKQYDSTLRANKKKGKKQG